jgi:L-lactate utilization protein LutC
MRKTKQQLIEELDALQQNYADEKASIGQTLNAMQNEIVALKQQNTNLNLMMDQYEKTLMIMTKRLLEARED